MSSEMKSQTKSLKCQLALNLKSKQWHSLSWCGGSTCSDVRDAKTSPALPVLF